MCMCMRSPLALVMMIFSPNPLYDSFVFLICSKPLFFHEYYFDEPIDNPMLYDSNVDLGYQDDMFDVLHRNANHILSLGYYNGHDASLIHIAYTQWISAEKSCRTLSWISLLDFLWCWLCWREH